LLRRRPYWQRRQAITRYEIYSLVLRQSAIKQQPLFPHSPFDHPKHGLQPSAVWIEWISSAFFIFPRLTPRPSALSFISGIVIRFCFFVAGILFPFHLLPPSGFPHPILATAEPKAQAGEFQIKYLLHNIAIEQFAQAGEKKMHSKNAHPPLLY